MIRLVTLTSLLSWTLNAGSHSRIHCSVGGAASVRDSMATSGSYHVHHGSPSLTNGSHRGRTTKFLTRCAIAYRLMQLRVATNRQWKRLQRYWLGADASFIYNDQGTDVPGSDIPEDIRSSGRRTPRQTSWIGVETDEALIERSTCRGERTYRQGHQGLRQGTLTETIVPVICSSAFKNKGVQLLLDAVVNCCAKWNYRRFKAYCLAIQLSDSASDSEPPISSKQDYGWSACDRLTFVQVYSGVLKRWLRSQRCKDKEERISRLVI